jgi:hypothetical protein
MKKNRLIGYITNGKYGHKLEDIAYKIPPHLPLPKVGNAPLFGKEGKGEIFQ